MTLSFSPRILRSDAEKNIHTYLKVITTVTFPNLLCNGAWWVREKLRRKNEKTKPSTKTIFLSEEI